jgi:hypothetical protein
LVGFDLFSAKTVRFGGLRIQPIFETQQEAVEAAILGGDVDLWASYAQFSFYKCLGS